MYAKIILSNLGTTCNILPGPGFLHAELELPIRTELALERLKQIPGSSCLSMNQGIASYPLQAGTIFP